MTANTPQRVDVERFFFDFFAGCFSACPGGEWVRHSDYAALLHQLADYENRDIGLLILIAEIRKAAGDPNGKLTLDELVARIAKREAELTELRQACWDARAVLGFDNDGAPTPEALVHPTLAELVKRDAVEFRKDYDEACAEVCAEFEKRVAAERARDEVIAEVERRFLTVRDMLPSDCATGYTEAIEHIRAAFLAANGGRDETK